MVGQELPDEQGKDEKSDTSHRGTCGINTGVTIGFVALPLAMAFDVALGVLPQAGLYCAMVKGTVISALGGGFNADWILEAGP